MLGVGRADGFTAVAARTRAAEDAVGLLKADATRGVVRQALAGRTEAEAAVWLLRLLLLRADTGVTVSKLRA